MSKQRPSAEQLAELPGGVEHLRPDDARRLRELQEHLSDVAARGARLAESGINIARRTVAKYREVQNIPTSSKRRQFTQPGKLSL